MTFLPATLKFFKEASLKTLFPMFAGKGRRVFQGDSLETYLKMWATKSLFTSLFGDRCCLVDLHILKLKYTRIQVNHMFFCLSVWEGKKFYYHLTIEFWAIRRIRKRHWGSLEFWYIWILKFEDQHEWYWSSNKNAKVYYLYAFQDTFLGIILEKNSIIL